MCKLPENTDSLIRKNYYLQNIDLLFQIVSIYHNCVKSIYKVSKKNKLLMPLKSGIWNRQDGMNTDPDA